MASQLVEAAKRGNRQAIRRYLENYGSFNEHGRSPDDFYDITGACVAAAAHGQLSVFRELFDVGLRELQHDLSVLQTTTEQQHRVRRFVSDVIRPANQVSAENGHLTLLEELRQAVAIVVALMVSPSDELEAEFQQSLLQESVCSALSGRQPDVLKHLQMFQPGLQQLRITPTLTTALKTAVYDNAQFETLVEFQQLRPDLFQAAATTMLQAVIGNSLRQLQQFLDVFQLETLASADPDVRSMVVQQLPKCSSLTLPVLQQLCRSFGFSSDERSKILDGFVEVALKTDASPQASRLLNAIDWLISRQIRLSEATYAAIVSFGLQMTTDSCREFKHKLDLVLRLQPIHFEILPKWLFLMPQTQNFFVALEIPEFRQALQDVLKRVKTDSVSFQEILVAAPSRLRYALSDLTAEEFNSLQDNNTLAAAFNDGLIQTSTDLQAFKQSQSSVRRQRPIASSV